MLNTQRESVTRTLSRTGPGISNYVRRDYINASLPLLKTYTQHYEKCYMLNLLSRRQLLHTCAAGIGVSLSGCSFGNEQPDADTLSETEKTPTETGIETDTTPTTCEANYLAVVPETEEELAEEKYERRSFDNLSARQQEQFTSAVNEGQPPVSYENRSDWYGTTASQGNERRIPLVIEYRNQLYRIEVHHADYCE